DRSSATIALESCARRRIPKAPTGDRLMLIVVLAVSLALLALLMIDALKQRLWTRRKRRWHGYYKN
ncbi:MAG: hypothetical protein JWQ97_4089, partial [Phenylobacterium sp.]|nr:hypothetical protein [Phenylobacterium sp.]